MDEKLNWGKHIEKVYVLKVSAGIGAMSRIKPYMSHLQLYKPFIKYCLILIIVPLYGTIAVKYSKINCKNFKIVRQGILLEPVTMLDPLICWIPLTGKHLNTKLILYIIYILVNSSTYFRYFSNGVTLLVEFSCLHIFVRDWRVELKFYDIYITLHYIHFEVVFQ